MISRKTWEEFRESGLLWWINMILNIFGWAITLEMVNGRITDAYPARVKYRGFDEKTNAEGYEKVSEYLRKNITELAEEVRQ